jgi:hypothetical protein
MNVCAPSSSMGCSSTRFEYKMGDGVSGNEKEEVAGVMYDEKA